MLLVNSTLDGVVGVGREINVDRGGFGLCSYSVGPLWKKKKLLWSELWLRIGNSECVGYGEPMYEMVTDGDRSWCVGHVWFVACLVYERGEFVSLWRRLNCFIGGTQRW